MFVSSTISTTCGRVFKDGYCVPANLGACPKGEFRGKDTNCYPCSKPERVVVDLASDCDDFCPATSENPREYHDGWCYKTCGENELNLGNKGLCQSCSKIGKGSHLSYNSWGDIKTFDKESCRTKCGKNKHDIYIGIDQMWCAPVDCGDGYLRHVAGGCKACLTSGSMQVNSYKTECEKCANHIYIGNYCVYYNPRVSGVCNEDSPDINKYPNIPNGTTYRDETGVCRRCDDTAKGYKATQAECDSCGGIRQLVGGICTYGGCLQNETFIGRTGCIACNTASIKVETKTSTEATQLCNDCNRRVMIVNDVPYCVQECDAEEWQDITGECHAGIMDSSDGKNEIGSDSISINKCHNAGRVVEEENNQYFCMPK